MCIGEPRPRRRWRRWRRTAAGAGAAASTKMELVLSPGNLGGDSPDGGPFRNEDVREWSRVDRITGMLERARVETGRWRANTRDAAQSYGKMIDSRERNSADGSLVQKARRQVEIFQSQGTGGRSFQVVRASQWSSSRATDSVFDVPLTKPSNTHYVEEDGTNGDLQPSPRLSLWRASLDDASTAASSDLEQLSCLCRKLHNEAMHSSSRLWSLRSAAPLTSSTRSLSPLDDDSIEDEPLDLQHPSERLSSLAERRSNSSEDVTSLALPDAEAFARDCKTRRSLQITNNLSDHHHLQLSHGGKVNGVATTVGVAEEDRARGRNRKEFIAERARRFEEAAEDGLTNGTAAVKRNFISTKSFTSIADNDFVKNDPNHPSKFNQVAKISIQDNAQNSQATHRLSSPVSTRRFDPTAVTGAAAASRKANNKTVVHLRNIASPGQVDEAGEPPRCINVVTAIKVEKSDGETEAASENGTLYGMLDTCSSTSTREDSMTQMQPATNGTKPVKRVEFCKTEIHFAADSGKVNIVETDGKPPPTNKFRRRRRNNSLGATANNSTQKSNMPLVHFGDTSYEKYIFGGGKLHQPPHDVKKVNGTLSDGPTIEENNGKSFAETDARTVATDEETAGNGRELCATTRDASLERFVDHAGKYRGNHTTTVNFLSDENNVALPKASEGRPNLRGIQLQFAASGRSLSPLGSYDDEDEDDEFRRSVVSRTTKITVHLPPAMTGHQRPVGRTLQSPNPFSNLKSVRLVMSVGRELGPSSAGSLTLRQLLARLYGDDEEGVDDAGELWSSLLQLKSADCLEDDGLAGDGQRDQPRILDRSRMITDKPSVFPTTNHVVHKDVGALSERLPNKNQVVSKDSDNNQVLLKIVTTHKPMLARVENDHTPNPLKSRLRSPGGDLHEDNEVANHLVDESDRDNSQDATCADIETKDHCDNNKEINDMVSNCIEAPTYENIFDAVSDGAPVYENFQIVKNNTALIERNIDSDKIPVKKRLSNVQSEKVASGLYDRRHKKVSPKISNGSIEDSGEKSNKIKPDRIKSSRSVTPMGSLSSTKGDKNSSHTAGNTEAKHISKSSSRSSNSRDSSIKRSKDAKLLKEDSKRGTQARRKNSSKDDSTVQEHKSTSSNISAEKNGETLRSKKPVEVVYQTAVFNMKNEKLSKPTKAKEVKGPRLINDLICGSKMRRPSDSKRIIKTAIVSQNTSKRKETPTTMNR